MEVLGFGVLRMRGFRCNWGLHSRLGQLLEAFAGVEIMQEL